MTEPAARAQARRLLRNIDRPDRLRGHPLVVEHPLCTPRQLVEAALESLPPRYRAILMRCDLAKERHAAVAAALGISERHFYRERQRAIAALAEALAALPARTPAVHAADADPTGTYVSCAAAFANVGRLDDAIGLLDRALGHGGPIAGRGAIAIRLAHLCRETGAFDHVDRYLSLAEAAAHDSRAQTCDRDLLVLQAQTIRAVLLLRDGCAADARQLIEDTIHRLRTTVPDRHAAKASAIVTAYVVLIDVLDTFDAFGPALDAAFEAVHVAKRGGVEPALRFRAQVALTQLRIQTATPISAVLDEVAADYEFARANGLPRDCAEAAALFCVLYSYSGQLARALAFGKRALEIDRWLAVPGETHRCYVAWALMRTGDTAAARATLSEISAGTDPSFESVLPQLIEAEALHVERRHRDALGVARTAVHAMRRAGSERGLGSALRVQAEIQGALGEKRSALQSIDQALSLLGKNGPPFALAQAYGCSARLSGNRRHRRAAVEMMQLFRT